MNELEDKLRLAKQAYEAAQAEMKGYEPSFNRLRSAVITAEEKLKDVMAEIVASRVDCNADSLEFCGLHRCSDKESPVYPYCVYDAIEDPSWDMCLMCHDPYERK